MRCGIIVLLQTNAHICSLPQSWLNTVRPTCLFDSANNNEGGEGETANRRENGHCAIPSLPDDSEFLSMVFIVVGILGRVWCWRQTGFCSRYVCFPFIYFYVCSDARIVVNRRPINIHSSRRRLQDPLHVAIARSCTATAFDVHV